MNLVTLVNTEGVMLSSGKLVYAVDETHALRSSVATAEALATLLSDSEARVARAADEGRSSGYEAGRAVGLEEIRNTLATEMTRLADQARQAQEVMQAEAVTLAMQIVRRIAADLAPEDSLLALAQSAAQECREEQSVVLRVHPWRLRAVQEKITLRAAAGKDLLITDAVADASLPESGCVLETRFGAIVADLDTQLDALTRNLDGASDG